MPVAPAGMSASLSSLNACPATHRGRYVGVGRQILQPERSNFSSDRSSPMASPIGVASDRRRPSLPDWRQALQQRLQQEQPISDRQRCWSASRCRCAIPNQRLPGCRQDPDPEIAEITNLSLLPARTSISAAATRSSSRISSSCPEATEADFLLGLAEFGAGFSEAVEHVGHGVDL